MALYPSKRAAISVYAFRAEKWSAISPDSIFTSWGLDILYIKPLTVVLLDHERLLTRDSRLKVF